MALRINNLKKGEWGATNMIEFFCQKVSNVNRVSENQMQFNLPNTKTYQWSVKVSRYNQGYSKPLEEFCIKIFRECTLKPGSLATGAKNNHMVMLFSSFWNLIFMHQTANANRLNFQRTLSRQCQVSAISQSYSHLQCEFPLNMLDVI